MTRLSNRTTTGYAACWMLRRRKALSRKPDRRMSMPGPKYLPRSQTWRSAQEIPSNPQRGRSHECESHFQLAQWGSGRHPVADRLRKSPFVRHSRFVFPGMAALFRRRHPAYRSLTRTLAPICGDRLADCDVSEPDGAVRICVVAHAVSLNTEIQAMNTTKNTGSPRLSRWLSLGIVTGAVLLGLIVLYRQNYHP